MRSRSCRRGFTLTQVLAVLVVALLVVFAVGLLLPSVSRVRGASYRILCQNNLKQIGLALHNYANVHPVIIPEHGSSPCFPAGTVVHPDLAPGQRLSWIAELLPYLEQDNLYRALNREVGWESNGAAVRTHVSTLRCPGWQRDQPRVSVERTPYLGAAGIGPDAAQLPEKHPRAGVFSNDRRTALAQITDGTANTVMLLESARQNGPWAAGGPATLRGLDPGDQPYTGPGRQFGGTHFGDGGLFGRGPYVGCNLAFADGSVRTVREDVPPATLEALLTAAGGEDVRPDW